jgi:hypothetical protein
MMRLQELQRAFQARVLRHQAGIESVLNNPHDADFEPRLDTYVGGYRTRLVEALGATYPVLQTTLGSDEFSRQMRDYINATHSQHYSVREYGADIAQWLTSNDDSSHAKRLAELARWEWTLADVFDARDDDPLDMAALARVPAPAWPGLSFTLRACVRRFETHSNIVQCWRAANNLCEPPAELIDEEPSQWLLWRRGVKTFFRSLDTFEAPLLDAARTGETFGELCERIAPCVPESEVAFRAASVLRGWMAEELIADYALALENE